MSKRDALEVADVLMLRRIADEAERNFISLADRMRMLCEFADQREREAILSLADRIEQRAALLSLADRIAAKLPPRKEIPDACTAVEA
jgi:hypothetical protein